MLNFRIRLLDILSQQKRINLVNKGNNFAFKFLQVVCDHFVNSALERERIASGGHTTMFQKVIGEQNRPHEASSGTVFQRVSGIELPGAESKAATDVMASNPFVSSAIGSAGVPPPPWLVKTSGNERQNAPVEPLQSKINHPSLKTSSGVGGIGTAHRIMMVIFIPILMHLSILSVIATEDFKVSLHYQKLDHV